MAKGDGYNDVDLAPNQKGGSHFFIEGSTKLSLITTLGMMAVFLAMHAYAAFKAPPLLAVKEDYFKLNSSEGNVSIDVDVTLSQLLDSHRFISINGSLVAKDANLKKEMSATLSTRTTSLKNFAIVHNDQDDRHTVNLAWKGGCNRSTGFFVDRSDVVGVDTLQVRMSMQTDYTGLDGFLFTWSFANPSAEKYARSAKLLMSFLVGYMLVVFVFYLKFDAESFSQIYLLVLGVAGVMASNPLGLLLGDSVGVRIADQVLLAAFVALVRLFTLLEFEMLRKHEVKVPTWLLLVLLVVFGIYATIDATAGYDRHSHIVHAEQAAAVVLQSEVFALCGHAIYFVGGLVWCILAWVSNQGANPRRMGYFAFVFCLGSVATLVLNGLCVVKNWGMYSVVREMLFISVQITIASITMFLLHSGGGPEYLEVGEAAKKGVAQEDIVIGLDDAEGQDDGAAEVEEEDDAEE